MTTEGIIQKAFNMLYDKQWSNYYHTKDIQALEHKLIAEVEKKFANKNVEKFTCSIFSLVELRRLLIGDN